MTTTPFNCIRDNAIRLNESSSDYDALLNQVGERSVVLLGECTHGTHEFYQMRAEISQRLIDEKGFDAVLVEGDWPDVYRLNRFVHGRGDARAIDAFADFERFPRWMWRNRDVLEFVSWLAEWNRQRPETDGTGFYGMDLYSLYRSADAVVGYLEEQDPDQASVARRVYTCLDHVRDPQQYGYEAVHGLRPDCREALQRQLTRLRGAEGALDPGTGLLAMDERFYAEHNAQVVRSAEAYYRAMFSSRVSSWNLRDEHMAATVLKLQEHLRRRGGTGKIIVWAHNSHVGDARATQMGRRYGELNLGQLMRQLLGPQEVILVGFTTYTGWVAAAHDWDGEVEHFALRPAMTSSYEYLFYRTGLDRFYLPLDTSATDLLKEDLMERAVGVIYRPGTERASHYFDASLANQFDAVFHIDETSAVEPFDLPHHWRRESVHG